MNLYKAYADAWIKERKYHEVRESLKPRVLSNVAKSSEGKVKNEYGTFLLADYTIYKYSTKVEDLEEKLAKLKAKEIAENIAVKKTDVTLRFLNR